MPLVSWSHEPDDQRQTPVLKATKARPLSDSSMSVGLAPLNCDQPPELVQRHRPAEPKSVKTWPSPVSFVCCGTALLSCCQPPEFVQRHSPLLKEATTSPASSVSISAGSA